MLPAGCSARNGWKSLELLIQFDDKILLNRGKKQVIDFIYIGLDESSLGHHAP